MAVLDTGRSSSCVGSETLKSYERSVGKNFERRRREKLYQFADGNRGHSRKVAQVSGASYQILEGSTPFLIGLDILNGSRFTMGLETGTLELPSGISLKTSRINGLHVVNVSDLDLSNIALNSDDRNGKHTHKSNTEKEFTLIVKDLESEFNTLKKLHTKHDHADIDQLKERYRYLDFDKELLDAVIASCKACGDSRRVQSFKPKSTTKKFRYVGACLCLDTLYVEVGGETAAVLHLVDAFSKYSLILVKVGSDTTGQDTVKLLEAWRDVFGGPPAAIFSDRGTEFLNKVVAEYLSAEGVFHYAAVEHRSNGFVEVGNRDFRRRFEKIAKVCPKCAIPEIANAAKRAKNSYIRRFDGCNASSQRVALGNDPCWIPTNAADVAELLSQRQELQKAAAEAVNIDADRKEIKEVIASEELKEFSTGQHVYVLIAEPKDKVADAERFRIGEVQGKRSNKIYVIRLNSGEILEVHLSKIFPLPAYELELPNAKAPSTETNAEKPVNEVNSKTETVRESEETETVRESEETETARESDEKALGKVENEKEKNESGNRTETEKAESNTKSEKSEQQQPEQATTSGLAT